MPALTAVDIATGAVIAMVFSLLKPFAEVVIVPGTKLHDPALRLLVIVIGAIVGLFQAGMVGTALDGHGVLVALLDGGKEGLIAITAYHLIPGSLLPPVTTDTPKTLAHPSGLVVANSGGVVVEEKHVV